jgi:hypothetical protein
MNDQTNAPPDAGSPVLTVGIDDVPNVVRGVSRTRVFEAVRNEEITIREAGRSSLVEMDELRRWVKTLPTKGRQPEAA